MGPQSSDEDSWSNFYSMPPTPASTEYNYHTAPSPANSSSSSSVDSVIFRRDSPMSPDGSRSPSELICDLSGDDTDVEVRDLSGDTDVEHYFYDEPPPPYKLRTSPPPPPPYKQDSPPPGYTPYPINGMFATPAPQYIPGGPIHSWDVCNHAMYLW